MKKSRLLSPLLKRNLGRNVWVLAGHAGLLLPANPDVGPAEIFLTRV